MTTADKVTHTPGPWEAVVVYDGPNWSYLVNWHQPEPDTATLKANANLIASAPEMLEALETLIAEREAMASPDAWYKVKTAIRKARGE